MVRSEETLEKMLQDFRLELLTDKASSFGTYEVVTAPIRGTFDSHLHKGDTPMRTEQNLKGLPIFLTTMIGVKCRRPGGDWKICVHAQIRLWPSVVRSKVKPTWLKSARLRGERQRVQPRLVLYHILSKEIGRHHRQSDGPPALVPQT